MPEIDAVALSKRCGMELSSYDDHRLVKDIDYGATKKTALKYNLQNARTGVQVKSPFVQLNGALGRLH